MSPLRALRRSLRSCLTRYAAGRALYQATSWAFTRSAIAPKRLFPTVVNAFFPAWVSPRLRLAGHLLGDGKPEHATAIVDGVLARNPAADLSDDSLGRLARIYDMRGRSDDAARVFQHIEERRCRKTSEMQYDRLGLRFFPRDNYWSIGPLGLFDKYIKGEILGIIPQCRNIILGSPENFSNPAYVRCWEKYFEIITESRTISLLAPLCYPLQAQMHVVWAGDRVRPFLAFARDVQLQWETENRGPLLSLSDEHREKGYRLLRELGVPEGAWFVGLHVREAGSKE